MTIFFCMKCRHKVDRAEKIPVDDLISRYFVSCHGQERVLRVESVVATLVDMSDGQKPLYIFPAFEDEAPETNVSSIESAFSIYVDRPSYDLYILYVKGDRTDSATKAYTTIARAIEQMHLAGVVSGLHIRQAVEVRAL